MGKVVLITGISSGFGKETARILSENGYTVYGTVRRDVSALKQVNYLKMDLTDIQSIKIAVSSVIAKEGRIDILINNGGMHTGGPVETSPIEYARLQMDTNFMGMASLTREVLPVMRNQGGGMIINFSSIGGLMGLPFQAFYSAGKFAIEGFSQALRMELKNFNIKVVVINPGDFNTNNTTARRSYLAPTGDEDPYNKQFSRSLEVIEKEEIKGGKPETLARKMLKIIDSPNPRNRYIIASFEQKLAVYVKYLLPEKWFDRILMSHYKIH